jgi:hypothetical protein
MHLTTPRLLLLLILIASSAPLGYGADPAAPDAKEDALQLKAWQNLRDISELSQVPLSQVAGKKVSPGIVLYQKSTNGTADVDFDKRMGDEDMAGKPTTGAYLTIMDYNSFTKSGLLSLLATDPEGKSKSVSIPGHSEFTMYKIVHKEQSMLIAYYRVIKIYRDKKLIEKQGVIENFYKSWC